MRNFIDKLKRHASYRRKKNAVDHAGGSNIIIGTVR